MSKSLVATDLKVREKRPVIAGAEFPFEPLLDTREAAAMLGIHPKTLQRLARSRRVPGVRIGKCWAFRASALDHWLKSQIVS